MDWKNLPVTGRVQYFDPAQAASQQAAPVRNQKKKKDFWLDQISTAGGIIGGIAGIPLGILGAAGGSAAGSAAGEALENVITGDDPTNNVLQEAVLGGVLGAGPLRLGGALLGKIAPRAGKTIEQGGKNLLGTQANLTRAEARKLGTTPAETMGTINQQTGLTNINQMADVGKNVTGKDGVLSELTRNAIGNTKGVDISDLQKVADDLLVNKAPSVTGSVRKNLKEQIKNNVVKAYGGSKGSLSTTADPFGAFDVARSFEANAARLRTLPNPTSADKELADVYSSLSREINRRLFNAPGVAEGVALARPQAAASFRQLAQQAPTKTERRAYEKLAQQAGQFTDVPGIRSAQAPYVQLGKIDDATAAAQSGAAAQLGDNLQGLGRIVQRPTNMVALPLNAATPRVGGMLTSVGRNLQGAGAPVTPKGVATRVGLGGAAADILGQGVQTEPQLDFAVMEAGPEMAMGASMEQAAQPEVSPYSRENLAYDIQRDPENADKYISYFQSLQEVYAQPETELSAGQQKTAVTAQNALGDVSILQDAIETGNINKNLIPFSDNALVGNTLGTNDLNAALFNIGDVILRSRTGAAAPKEEIEKFVAGYLPRAGESKETQLYKLQRAYSELLGMSNPPAALGVGTSGGGLEDALLAQSAY